MNKKLILLILVFLLLTVSIYTVDLFKLAYRLTGWEQFGEAPLAISHVEYFIPDTPNIIGYTDHALGEKVTCFEAVAFVETATGEPYRCCDAAGKVSCLEGDFSSDIPPTDEECIAELRAIFGAPGSLAGAKEYQFFGDCRGGRFAELTVVQLDGNGTIRWRHMRVETIQLVMSVLRCLIGPVLLLIIFYILYRFQQERTAETVRRI